MREGGVDIHVWRRRDENISRQRPIWLKHLELALMNCRCKRQPFTGNQSPTLAERINPIPFYYDSNTSS
jgi:hypothetical protein